LHAWQKPETIIVHEPWWTPMARHADVVLPANTPLERNDMVSTPRDGFLLANKQALPPVGKSRSDHDILTALADRLGFRERFTEGRDEMGWLRHLYETSRTRARQRDIEMPEFEEFWEAGLFELPPPEDPPVFLAAFRDDPDTQSLRTPSGKIEIWSERIASYEYEDCPPHATWMEPAEWLGGDKAKQYPLHLVSNQPVTRLHSQLDQGVVSQEAKVAGREPLLMHPHDAATRGISSGDVVRVFNDRGQCLAGAVVTANIQPHVVQLATGAWYDPLEPGVPGTLEKNGNPNVLTLDKGTSKLGQGSSAHTALVEVEGYAGVAPPVTVFAPPKILTISIS
jgi:biotin/methionine sulfoxide reductase